MDTIEASYNTEEVAKLAGVTFRQLDYWCRSESVTPSVCNASGSGTHRRWSMDDAACICAIGRAARDLEALSPGTISRDFVRRCWDAWHDARSKYDAIVLAVGVVTVTLRGQS